MIRFLTSKTLFAQIGLKLIAPNLYNYLLKISVFEQRRKRNHGIRIEEVEEATLGGTEIQKYLIPSIELSL
jgi:hypothetical protein